MTMAQEPSDAVDVEGSTIRCVLAHWCRGCSSKEVPMRPLLLWLVGVPIPIIAGLWAFGYLS
jgi:hypothetical protein